MNSIELTGNSHLEIIELAIRSPLPSSKSTVCVDVAAISTFESGLSGLDIDINSIDRAESASSNASITANANSSSLAPVDKGFGAWSFLLAAYLIEMIVWGFPNSSGVFLEAYLHDSQYNSQAGASSLLPLIGPLASGIMYCSGIVIYPIFNKYPQHRRKAIIIGHLLCFGSLFAAGFTEKISEMILLQGVLYALGGSILYAPCISYMSEWFVVRRGLANGVMFSGAGFGGTILPFVISRLLQKHSPRKALQLLAIAMACIITPVLPFLKGRLPHNRVVGPAARLTADRSWMKNSTLWLVIAMNTVQGFGHFLPAVWLPTSTFFGQAGLGMLSDRFNPWALALGTLIFTSMSTFVLWGVLSSTFAGLAAFGIAFGILAGGFSSLWSAFVNIIVKDDPFLATSLFSYLLFSRGIGNIFSTPISSALIRSHRLWDSADVDGVSFGFNVGGGRFENVIVYSGSCFAGAAVIAILGWMVGRSRI